MKKLISLLAITLILISCSKETTTSTNSWVGKFTGSDSGTVNITISNNTVSGYCKSSISNTTYTIQGSVSSSGVIDATLGTVTSGANFKGTLNGNLATGTWINYTYSGNWSATKQ